MVDRSSGESICGGFCTFGRLVRLLDCSGLFAVQDGGCCWLCLIRSHAMISSYGFAIMFVSRQSVTCVGCVSSFFWSCIPFGLDCLCNDFSPLSFTYPMHRLPTLREKCLDRLIPLDTGVRSRSWRFTRQHWSQSCRSRDDFTSSNGPLPLPPPLLCLG